MFIHRQARESGRPGGTLLLGLLGGIELDGLEALSTIVAIEVVGHEDSGSAHGVSALLAEADDLALGVNLVVLEGGKLDLLVLVSDLLGGGVVLLFALLSTSEQAESRLKGGVVGKAVLKSSLIDKLKTIRHQTKVGRITP